MTQIESEDYGVETNLTSNNHSLTEMDTSVEEEQILSITNPDEFIGRNCVVDVSLSKGWKYFLPQILACCAVHSIVINCGISMVYSAVLLPELMEAGSGLLIDGDQASWIASLVAISTPVGALLTGPLMDKLGRKTVCKISIIPIGVSWILIATAKNVITIYIARLFGGIGTGLSTAALVYVSEVSHAQLRPTLLSLNSVFFSLGILLTCLSGAWLSWRSTAVWCAGLCLVIFLLLWILPESPQWLATYSKGNENSVQWKQAQKSLQWLYRNEQHIHEEIELLRENFKGAPVVNGVCTTKRNIFSFVNSITAFKRKSAFKPIFLLIILFVLQQLSGAYVLIFYAVHLFRKIGGKLGSGVNEFGALIIMGSIRFLMSFFVSMTAHKFGRRPLLMLSYIGMSFSALIVATYLYIFSPNDPSDLFEDNVQEGHWLPILFVLLFICFSAMGVLVIPWTLVVELLPIQVRGVASGFLISWAYFLMFFTVKGFPYLINITKMFGMFFILGIQCLIGFLYIYIYIPETLGKTFREIENHFK